MLEGEKEDVSSTGEKEGRYMVVETLVFIPYTKDSVVMKRLQEVDNLMGEATGTPSVRFVERCGECLKILSSKIF